MPSPYSRSNGINRKAIISFTANETVPIHSDSFQMGTCSSAKRHETMKIATISFGHYANVHGTLLRALRSANSFTLNDADAVADADSV